MNSIDDFARVRPDVDLLDEGRLDALWADIVSETRRRERGALGETGQLEFVAAEEWRRPTQRRARRLAVYGAAAALALGVAGITIVLSSRTDAPPPVQDAVTTLPAEDVTEVVTTAVDAALVRRDREPAAGRESSVDRRG